MEAVAFSVSPFLAFSSRNQATFFWSSTSVFSYSPHSSTALRILKPFKPCILIPKRRRSAVLSCSAAEKSPPFPSERWLLEPVGDGDYRHIGYPVPPPSAFEIVSNAVTVGRVPEKADIVIPVATVSAVHARLEKKDGQLLVTDLDSTNGTFVEEKRVMPGEVSAVPPGSRITFGDTNLAIFRATKIEVETIDEPVETTEETTAAAETAT